MNKKLIMVLFLFILVLINYADIFPNKFAWDDGFFIVENIHIKDPNNIPEFFTEPSTGNLYRPLRSVFYTITYKIWNLNAFGYHLNSLVLHSLVTLLLFFITLKITNKISFSFIASLFFAAHPVHTARITNMTATFDVFGILFMLLAFFFYILQSKLNTPINNKKSFGFFKRNYPIFSVIFYLLALFSTEEAVTLILILFLYDFSFNKTKLKNLKCLFMKYLPYIAVTIFYLVVRFIILQQIGREKVYFEHSFFGTMLTTVKIFVEYIILLFLPFNLTIEQIVKFETSVFSISFLISIFILLLIALYFVKSFKKSKVIFFSIGWFFITLLPFSNIFPQFTIMADRYLYLPSYGFCLFLAFVIFRVNRIIFLKKYYKTIIILLVISITVVYTSITIQRNAEWKDDFTLLTKTFEKNPLGTRTNNALAIYYKEKGDYGNAIKYSKLAVVLSDKNFHAYENLGTIYAYLGEYNTSIPYYKKSLELNPDFYLANNNLGLVYSYLGDLNKSVFYLKKAVKSNPKLAKAYNDLGTVYAKMGEFEEGIEKINKAIKINPYEADYYYNLAIIYEFLKDEKKAEELLIKASEIEPDNKKIKSKLILFLG